MYKYCIIKLYQISVVIDVYVRPSDVALNQRPCSQEVPRPVHVKEPFSTTRIEGSVSGLL